MTDHAAEALFEIDRCRAGLPESSGGPREMEALAIAQVHATLALAEEQRTANLLAALDSIKRGIAGGVHTLDQALPVIVRLNEQVNARLGLTSTTPAAFEDPASHALDNKPCSTCGGDRLRPDFSKPGQPCHITPTTPNQEQ